jgi:hypothetical protein
MSFGIPTRNGLPLGLGTVASLASRATAAVVSATDTFFRYVTLLLNTSATNGAQNNTFLDSSTNNFSITRNGDTTQGSFNPYMPSGYWSGFFGSFNTSNIKIASNAAFGVGTGNFTVEFFLNLNAWSSTNQRYFIVGASGTDGIVIGRDSGANNLLVNISGTGSTNVITYAWTPNIGQWYHVALVRSGTGTNQVALYIDGVSVATGTTGVSVAQNAVIIGGLDWATGYSAQGYISNVRFSNTARTITVPTTPYTSDANTLVLACQDNRFKDNSTNAFAITVNGDTRISKFAPFNPPASYSTASYGGSGYFDGTGDYLRIADNVAFTLGSGDFTVEAWVYNGTSGTRQFISAQGDSSGFQTSISYFVEKTAANKFRSGVCSSSTEYAAVSTADLPLNQWVHVAFVRNGNTGTNYINGVADGTVSLTGVTVNDSTNQVAIGALGELTSLLYTGYISNFRLVKGTAVYTANFTPPTTPLTAITNTSLLLNFTNAGIFDAATINDGQTVGNAQVSTTQAKWPPTGMYFDGTGDAIVLPRNAAYSFGGDFTIECWVYYSTSAIQALFDTRNTDSLSAYLLDINASDKLDFIYGTSVRVTSATSIPKNQWAHVAVARSSGTIRLFIDGVLDANTASTSAAINAASFPSIGGGRSTVADSITGYYLNGYIQDLRITNGYARYTANFTPPTAAFPTL